MFVLFTIYTHVKTSNNNYNNSYFFVFVLSTLIIWYILFHGPLVLYSHPFVASVATERARVGNYLFHLTYFSCICCLHKFVSVFSQVYFARAFRWLIL